MLLRQAQELLVIVDVFLGAISEHQPQLLVLVTWLSGQQPMQHGAKRSDPGPGGDEDGIAQGRAQNEIAEWSLAMDFSSHLHVAKKVGHEAVLHAVQAQGEPVVASRRRCDRVGAGDLVAIRHAGLEGEPLSGYEAKTGDAGYFKFEMFGLFGKGEGPDQTRAEGLQWHHLCR